jgi:SAM-dependent methyltransferase
MIWIAAILALVLIGFLLDREVYFYEGVHLGPSVQAWLYDRWAGKYDEGKRLSQLHDDKMLAGPLLEALKDVPEPFVLDFATGTGRLSATLLRQPEFRGRIVALDLSQAMLEKAAAKLSQSSDRVDLLRHLSLPLPFPEAAFDAVCALEVLELFPGMEDPLQELARVLRPGGTLLTSRGTEESGRRARVKSKTEFTALLERKGFERIQITTWWKLFDRVFAVRQGSSEPVGARRLIDVLRCMGCGQIRWQADGNTLRCQNCAREISITNAGIVLNSPP